MDDIYVHIGCFRFFKWARVSFGKIVDNHFYDFFSQLHWPFEDGDRWHSKENVMKMSNGLPLTDEVSDYVKSHTCIIHNGYCHLTIETT